MVPSAPRAAATSMSGPPPVCTVTNPTPSSASALTARAPPGDGNDAPSGGVVVGTGPGVTTGSSSANGGSGAEGGSGGMAQGGSSSQGAGMPTDEDCYDGIDNDQNGDTDCVSPDEACAAICTWQASSR